MAGCWLLSHSYCFGSRLGVKLQQSSQKQWQIPTWICHQYGEFLLMLAIAWWLWSKSAQIKKIASLMYLSYNIHQTQLVTWHYVIWNMTQNNFNALCAGSAIMDLGCESLWLKLWEGDSRNITLSGISLDIWTRSVTRRTTQSFWSLRWKKGASIAECRGGKGNNPDKYLSRGQ